LGGKTSTMQFTSEEVQKLKRQQKQLCQPAPAPPPKPRTSASGLLESSFDLEPVPAYSDEAIIMSPKNPIGSLHSKSTPSLELQQNSCPHPQLSPRSTASEPQQKTSSNSSSGGRWKNSLDSLNRPQVSSSNPSSTESFREDGIPRGFIAAPSSVTQPPM
jgi:hypothetical protein